MSAGPSMPGRGSERSVCSSRPRYPRAGRGTYCCGFVERSAGPHPPGGRASAASSPACPGGSGGVAGRWSAAGPSWRSTPTPCAAWPPAARWLWCRGPTARPPRPACSGPALATAGPGRHQRPRRQPAARPGRRPGRRPAGRGRGPGGRRGLAGPGRGRHRAPGRGAAQPEPGPARPQQRGPPAGRLLAPHLRRTGRHRGRRQRRRPARRVGRRPGRPGALGRGRASRGPWTPPAAPAAAAASASRRGGDWSCGQCDLRRPPLDVRLDRTTVVGPRRAGGRRLRAVACPAGPTGPTPPWP